MTAIGETLRRERVRRNLGLEEISRELKISARMLDAIEQERFDRLPGGVFAKSFVRQYAKYLGLDEEELAGEVQRVLQPPIETAAPASRPQVHPIALPKVDSWEAVGDSRYKWSSPLSALALVVVVMLGCAGIYSFWQRSRHPVSTHISAPPAVAPPSTVAAAPALQPPAQQPPASEQPPAATPAQPETKPVEPLAGAPPTASPVATAPAGPSQAPAVPTTTPLVPKGPVHVELVAQEPVWVLARTDGKYSFSGTLDANQTRTVDANSTVELRLGNAGGVNITLNGKPIGAVGPKGQVRTVQLTSGGFEIVAAPKPPAVPLDPLL